MSCNCKECSVLGSLDKKGGRRCHLLLGKRWHLLPPYFMSNEPGTDLLSLGQNLKKVLLRIREALRWLSTHVHKVFCKNYMYLNTFLSYSISTWKLILAQNSLNNSVTEPHQSSSDSTSLFKNQFVYWGPSKQNVAVFVHSAFSK
jgi:hypothetical protein